MLIKSPVLESILRRNEPVYRAIEACGNFLQQDYYIGAGCIAQSYWNSQHGFPLMSGIKDIDIIFFDPNCDKESELALNRKAKEVFSFSPIPVEVVNQARVHEWYLAEYGISMSPYRSLEDAIDSWPTTSTALGARMINNQILFYNQFGLRDFLNLEVRPNKKLINEKIYLEKVNRWKALWPKLSVHSW